MIEGLGRGSRNILVGKRSAVQCLQKVSHDVRHVIPGRPWPSRLRVTLTTIYDFKFELITDTSQWKRPAKPSLTKLSATQLKIILS